MPHLRSKYDMDDLPPVSEDENYQQLWGNWGGNNPFMRGYYPPVHNFWPAGFRNFRALF